MVRRQRHLQWKADAIYHLYILEVVHAEWLLSDG
jgi:hypothetical protein